MSRIPVIDSHIHLWPEETCNEDGHAWMTPGMPLAKPHLLTEYCTASRRESSHGPDIEVKGVVYVETDVRYDSPSDDVAVWAKGPLDEVSFLRSIVEGKYDEHGRNLLIALILWAPMHQPTSTLKEYLRLAEERAGFEVWKRAKGFRFLLQSIHDPADFEKLVLSENFIVNLQLLGRRGFSFDLGVDQRSGGSWQLEITAKAMEAAHANVPDDEKVTFVVNHLCKPDFTASDSEFERWKDAIWTMSLREKTYMKLSGAFSELPTPLKSTGEIATHMKPWITHVLQSFGPTRIMFGSDWPVCNVGGPAGDRSWSAWTDVVQHILADNTFGLAKADCNSIWHDTATHAYRIRTQWAR